MTTDTLKLLIESGMLDLTMLSQEILMKERELYLSRHTYRIYQGKDGAWYTYIPDDTKKNGRRKIRRVNKESLEDEVINYFKQEEKKITGTIECMFNE